MDIAVIKDMEDRSKAPGLNLQDKELMLRAVNLMTLLYEDNSALASMARKPEE